MRWGAGMAFYTSNGHAPDRASELSLSSSDTGCQRKGRQFLDTCDRRSGWLPSHSRFEPTNPGNRPNAQACPDRVFRRRPVGGKETIARTPSSAMKSSEASRLRSWTWRVDPSPPGHGLGDTLVGFSLPRSPTTSEHMKRTDFTQPFGEWPDGGSHAPCIPPTRPRDRRRSVFLGGTYAPTPTEGALGLASLSLPRGSVPRQLHRF
jgi:hypothetical protein